MIMSQSVPCHHCNGTGEIIRDKCPHCNDGLVVEDVEISIDIPAGMFGDGAQMLERGRGHYAPRRKGSQGDLIVAVIEIPSKKGLKRDDHNNITYTKRVDYWTMVEGGEITIPYIGNDIKINVSPGSESGKKVTLPRKGFADPNGRQPNADYIVTLEVFVPDVRYMSDEQKDALKSLKNSFC
jgi:molecular chaperone DnaJ